MDSRTQRPRSSYKDTRNYAIYTRYPGGIGGRFAEDLKCPKCGAEEITILKEFEHGASGMLGDSAQCWICKHEFKVTDNCWHDREKEPWK